MVSFLGEERKDIHLHPQRGRQWHASQRDCTRPWRTYRERPALCVTGHDARDRSVAVENGQGAPSAYRAEVLAQAGLEVGDPDGIHDHNLVMTGHVVNARRCYNGHERRATIRSARRTTSHGRQDRSRGT